VTRQPERRHGGLDAIAFAGGSGESDAQVRAGILAAPDRIARDADVPVTPADEKRRIALETRALREAGK